jgi:hypothetical protein
MTIINRWHLRTVTYCKLYSVNRYIVRTIHETELTELIVVPDCTYFLRDHTGLTVRSQRAVLRLREAMDDSHFFQQSKLSQGFLLLLLLF